MTIHTIKIDRLFAEPSLGSTERNQRTVVALTLAVSALVAVPATPVDTSSDLRTYFLEQVSAIQPALDDIREVVLFNTDSVLNGAYSLWSKRYEMIHNCSGDAVLYLGNQYSDRLANIVPSTVGINDLKLTGTLVNEIMSFIRSSLGLNAAAGE